MGNIALVPLITALVGALRKAGMDKTYAPLASIVVGAAVYTLVAFNAGTLSLLSPLVGAALGLTASGLYDAGKPVGKKIKDTVGA